MSPQNDSPAGRTPLGSHEDEDEDEGVVDRISMAVFWPQRSDDIKHI